MEDELGMDASQGWRTVKKGQGALGAPLSLN